MHSSSFAIAIFDDTRKLSVILFRVDALRPAFEELKPDNDNADGATSSTILSRDGGFSSFLSFFPLST
ncbi:hypothetical protein HanRHA438_Chr13g0601311 [Helianthus annuus]|nr:hypothetical protein HanRHA438_Chr13g0601311 [Helianthus annuus]